jgi:hypothetical protein
MFLLALFPWAANVFCFLPILVAMTWPGLSTILPAPLPLLGIALLVLAFTFLVYSKTQELLAYASRVQIIRIASDSVSLQRITLGIRQTKRFPADDITGLTLLPPMSSLLPWRFRPSISNSQTCTLALLTNRRLRSVEPLAPGLPSADAQSLLSIVYGRSKQETAPALLLFNSDGATGQPEVTFGISP